MTEIEINRMSHLIDPHLQIWGWEIPVYLFLGGVTAGIMILAPLIAWRSRGEELSRWARWLPLAAPVLLSLGMIALFLDLSYKTHVLRFYGALRWSSPMSWGSWILLAIYPVTILLGLAGLTRDETTGLTSFKPIAALRLGGIVRWARSLGQRNLGLLRIASVALGVGLGGYTGLLLGTLGARHVWSSGVLGPLFLVSGISTGAALMMLFPLRHKEHGLLLRVDLAAIALELALIGFYFVGLVTGGADSREAASMFLGGRFTATFWSLVVIAGLLVPLILELIELGRSRRSSHGSGGHVLIAPALLLVGGLSLRWILVLAGQL